MNRPLVSVIVLTYRHEWFIKACLEGILDQDYSEYEIVVSDDASTDKTVQTVQSLPDRHGRIRLFQADENRGPSGNFVYALEQCRGDFIALCEGDDLWTDRRKLSVQMAEMISDQDVSLVYANYSKLDENGTSISDSVLTKQPDSFALGDMIDKHGPATNSVVIRRSAFPKKFPEVFHEVLNPDVFIMGYGLKQGKAAYIDKVLSTHREHGKGIWTSVDQFRRGLIRYSTLAKFYRSIGEEALKKRVLDLLERQVILAKTKDGEAFREYFGELPLSGKILLRLKWAYAKIKGSRS